MPLKYKVPGYAGNALLLMLSIIMLTMDGVVIGMLLGALALLNLYLIYKLDVFSRPETTLARELEMTKMREALIVEQNRVKQLEAGAPTMPAGPAT